MEGSTIKRTGRTCAPTGGRVRFGAAVESVVEVVVRFWGDGTRRYSLFLALELAPAPGDGQPCARRGQCCAGCGRGWKLEFGVCVWWPPSPGVRDKTHAHRQKTRQ